MPPHPKRKHSKSRRDMRRAHDALKTPQYYLDKDTGEPKRPHRVDPDTDAVTTYRADLDNPDSVDGRIDTRSGPQTVKLQATMGPPAPQRIDLGPETDIYLARVAWRAPSSRWPGASSADRSASSRDRGDQG